MKIALLGYGKIGRLIEKIAKEVGHEIVAVISLDQQATKAKLDQADVFIEFSHPSAVLHHVSLATTLKKPIVIGTTGWELQRDQIIKAIKTANIGCIYSPNFSIGVALFKAIVSKAAQLIKNLNEYDLAGKEEHHRTKVDSPSGTAIALQEIIEKEAGKIIEFSSVRCGSIPGIHEIVLDSPFDTIRLNHTAKSRDGFAIGAIKAAEWIKDKNGIFTMEDLCRFN